MNLIEQLGGYEEAKMLRGTTSNALLDMKTWTVHVDDIDLALLEHRRANNIFEVGDDVVFCNFLKGVSQKWLGETFKVIHVYEDEDVAAVSSSGVNTHLTLYTIKHATDAEIKAGRRL